MSSKVSTSVRGMSTHTRRLTFLSSVCTNAAVHLSRLEEEVQIEEWGMVEGGHDLDRADQNVRVAAPAVFMRLYKGV